MADSRHSSSDTLDVEGQHSYGIPQSCRQNQHILSQMEQEQSSNEPRRGDEFVSAEHFDKLLLQDIRTEFYKYNTQFEQVLKFKPIRKVHTSRVEVSLEKSYEAL